MEITEWKFTDFICANKVSILYFFYVSKNYVFVYSILRFLIIFCMYHMLYKSYYDSIADMNVNNNEDEGHNRWRTFPSLAFYQYGIERTLQVFFLHFFLYYFLEHPFNVRDIVLLCSSQVSVLLIYRRTSRNSYNIYLICYTYFYYFTVYTIFYTISWT